MFLQPTRSWCSVFFLRVVPFMMVFFALGIPANGISWLSAPDEHTYVEQGSPFRLHWHYRMDAKETFLSSEIKKETEPNAMASRHEGENNYHKHQEKDSSVWILGKNNVALNVDVAKIGRSITYCCKVVWKLVNDTKKDIRCSKVFVYDVPRIAYLIPNLSCKQGDSIKLQCNATGTPKPHLDWIHDDTNELIASSSDIVLNITGKRSEGRYCCDASNEFGKETACTTVNVTEYEPENTTLLVKQTNRDDVNIIHAVCKADASPPSDHFIIYFNGTQYNSSDGLKTIEVPAPKKDKRHEIAVSCIPCNKYGQGPIKKVVLLLYVPPSFKAPIRTQYNMTVSGIMLKCDATGIPTPNITWTKGDTRDIVGTGKYYQVPYVKYATRTMTFYCHVRNAMGNISSPEIHVKVMTVFNCSTADKGLDQTTQTFWKKSILIIFVVVALVIVIVIVIAIVIVIVIFIVIDAVIDAVVVITRKMEGREDAETVPIYEDPYQDPKDAVVPKREGSQITVEECLRPKWEVCIPMTTKPHPGEEDSYNKSVEQISQGSVTSAI